MIAGIQSNCSDMLYASYLYAVWFEIRINKFAKMRKCENTVVVCWRSSGLGDIDVIYIKIQLKQKIIEQITQHGGSNKQHERRAEGHRNLNTCVTLGPLREAEDSSTQFQTVPK
jgi:hypothetical protein